MLRHTVCAVIAASLGACYEPASTPKADANVVDAKPPDAKVAVPDGPMPETDCIDGFDGDRDGKIDCADSDCAANGFCVCHNVALPSQPGDGGIGDSFGRLDTPANDLEVVTNGSLIRGWALDNAGVGGVKLRIDNVRELPLTFGTPRTDVCSTYTGFPDCNNVGFQSSLDALGISQCQHLFEIVVTDSAGTTRVVVRRRVVVN